MTKDDLETCGWWLRTPTDGDFPASACLVSGNGNVDYFGYFVDGGMSDGGFGVRPAMYISLQS